MLRHTQAFSDEHRAILKQHKLLTQDDRKVKIDFFFGLGGGEFEL
jgi:hypothetical protein